MGGDLGRIVASGKIARQQRLKPDKQQIFVRQAGTAKQKLLLKLSPPVDDTRPGH